jgi:macrolide transport system ATP-binding/permease protein
MREPLLQLIGVTRCFRAGDHEMTVLRNIDLTIEAGEFVAIVGAPGSARESVEPLFGAGRRRRLTASGRPP